MYPNHLDLMYPYLGPAGRVHVSMMMLRGENGREVVKGVKAKVREINEKEVFGGWHHYRRCLRQDHQLFCQ
jgi:hypothetical protein